MSSIEVADQSFVAAPAERVAAAIAPPERWVRWFEGLSVTVQENRGPKGIRWSVGGDLTGTMEVWLEPSLDGVILHYFLHAEPNASGVDVLAITRARRIAGKAMSFEVKAELEAGRPPGEPPRSSSGGRSDGVP